MPEEIILLDFMVQGKMAEADTPTIRMGATPSRLNSTHLHHPSIVTPDALPAATLPLYPGLEQAPNMMACIPGGLVESYTILLVSIMMLLVLMLITVIFLVHASICQFLMFYSDDAAVVDYC